MKEASADRRASIFLVAVWFLCTLAWLRPGLHVPDGAGYYAYLPSVYFDGDLLLFDEWGRSGLIRDGRIEHKEITATQHLGNHWTVGTAVLWAPAFVLADLVRPLVAPASTRDGFTLPYNVAVVTTSAFLSLLTILLAFRVARNLGIGSIASAAGAISALFGTPLLWYGVQHATMSHAAAAFSCAAGVYCALRIRSEPTVANALLCGAAVGLAFSIRPQNAVIGIAPLLLAGAGLRERTRALGFVAGGLLGAAPQFVVSSWIYGSPFGFARLSSDGDPGRAWRPMEKVWLWEPLFSWYHGLFTWTPLVILALIGLAFLYRPERRVVATATILFFAQWGVNATLERTFWGATSFGQRRFDSWTIFVAVGVAALLHYRPSWWNRALVAAAAGWTFALFAAAATGALTLRHYRSFSETVTALTMTDVARLLKPLAFVPARAFVPVAVTFLIITTFLAALTLVAMRIAPKSLAAVAAAWLSVVTITLFICGTRDAAHLPKFARLIEFNQQLGIASGGTDTRIALLSDEVDFLERTGRLGEAVEARREAERLNALRAAAVERMRLRK